MNRRALVTGITGFIGGKLAKRLIADGWSVDALVRPGSDLSSLAFASRVTFHCVSNGQDLTSVVHQAKPDVVFHLASLYLAEHRSDQISALVESNILFPTLLAEAMAANGVHRLINTGTAWQQFNGPDYLPVNLYAATKQAAEDLLLYYVDAKDLSIVTLRLFDTYGDGDKRRKLIQILLDAARTQEPLAMSPGEQIVDMTHVDDVVNAFILTAERLLTETTRLREVRYVSGERQCVRDLAKKVERALGHAVLADFGGRPYRAREVMIPPAPGEHEKVPGWSRVHTIESYISGMSA